MTIALVKPYLLRFHRWITLVFALPLALLILTGLVLSFEPIVQDSATRAFKLPADIVVSWLERHDPEGKARGIAVRAYENRLEILGVGEDGSKEIDLRTGEEVDDSDATLLSDIFGTARSLHEHFIFDLEGVVIASTIAMVVLIVLGIVMGWPRLRNSVSGWHQAMAWFGLPLLLLSPITGLMLAAGVTFQTPVKQDRAALPPIKQAVQMIAKEHELGGLIWLRQRGTRLLARINEGGAFNIYNVSQSGVTLTPTNWPRGLHEGNFAGTWSGVMVLVTSIGFVGLLGTGLTLYLRRLLRKPNRVRNAPAA